MRRRCVQEDLQAPVSLWRRRPSSRAHDVSGFPCLHSLLFRFSLFLAPFPLLFEFHAITFILPFALIFFHSISLFFFLFIIPSLFEIFHFCFFLHLLLVLPHLFLHCSYVHHQLVHTDTHHNGLCKRNKLLNYRHFV